MQDFEFRLAKKRDIPDLALLINRAYRENHKNSWSNESRIVVGDRINQAQLINLIVPEKEQRNNTRLMVAEFKIDDQTEIFGCILIEFNQNTAEIGTFCIAPRWQNLKYGHQLLSKAEMYALKINPELYSYEMWVLNVRHELIDFYLRRAYVKTGRISSYPVDAGVGEPLIELHLIHLQKIA